MQYPLSFIFFFTIVFSSTPIWGLEFLKIKRSSSSPCGPWIEKLERKLDENSKDFKQQLETYIGLLEELSTVEKANKACRPLLVQHQQEWWKNLQNLRSEEEKSKLHDFLWRWMQNDNPLAFELAQNLSSLGVGGIGAEMEEAYYFYGEKEFPRGTLNRGVEEGLACFLRTDTLFSRTTVFLIKLLGSSFFTKYIEDVRTLHAEKNTPVRTKYSLFVSDFWNKNPEINAKFVRLLRWFYKKTQNYYSSIFQNNEKEEQKNLWVRAEMVTLLFFRIINPLLLQKFNNDKNSIDYAFDITAEFFRSISPNSNSLGFEGSEIHSFMDGMEKHFFLF